VRLTIIVLLLLFAMGSRPVAAKEQLHQIRTLGSGNDVEFDPQSIPVEMQTAYLVTKVQCTGACHSQERLITTLRTGTSPVTKQPYGQAEFRDKIIKIMRSPKSTLTRDTAKIVTDFFDFLTTKATLN
jgi:hypothetical protein